MVYTPQKTGRLQEAAEQQGGVDVVRQKQANLAAQKEKDVIATKAEARASNEKVNFEIEKVKIETQAKIEVATKTATIMAELGKNAQFVNNRKYYKQHHRKIKCCSVR